MERHCARYNDAHILCVKSRLKLAPLDLFIFRELRQRQLVLVASIAFLLESPFDKGNEAVIK